jgi:hypothetical protein
MRFKFNRWLGSLLLIAACLSVPVLETGCKHTLASNGVYAESNTNAAQANALYTTDVSINASKTVIQGFLRWEKDNRALVQAQWPDVTTYAIKLSNDAPKWLQSAVRLRDAYTANPTAANKTAFDAAMDVLNQAVTEAQKYLAQGVKFR